MLSDIINTLIAVSQALEGIPVAGSSNMGTFFNCVNSINMTTNQLIQINTKNQSENEDDEIESDIE